MKKPESKFNFGDRVRGKITGATGIVIGINFTMSGLVGYSVLPPATINESPADSFTVEEFYLEKVEK